MMSNFSIEFFTSIRDKNSLFYVECSLEQLFNLSFVVKYDLITSNAEDRIKNCSFNKKNVVAYVYSAKIDVANDYIDDKTQFYMKKNDVVTIEMIVIPPQTSVTHLAYQYKIETQLINSKQFTDIFKLIIPLKEKIKLL